MSTKYEPTTEADLRMLDVTERGEPIAIQLWDTSGNDSVDMSPMLFRSADGLILVIDLTNRDSFRALQGYWDTFVTQTGFQNQDFPCVVVGNKVDLTAERQVPKFIRYRIALSCFFVGVY
jgi:small GTP-binding protein